MVFGWHFPGAHGKLVAELNLQSRGQRRAVDFGIDNFYWVRDYRTRYNENS